LEEEARTARNMMLSHHTVAALLATGLISIAPNLLLFLFPSFGDENQDNSSYGGAILSLGQAIAAGGLLGDVFLHTLPHAMESAAKQESTSEQHNHDHDHELEVGTLVLAGFITFLVLDGFIRVLEDNHSHCHTHSIENRSDKNAKKDNGNDTGNKNGTQLSKIANENTRDLSKLQKTKRVFTSTVILNLAADALHNFTDGLTIGASFAISSKSGDNSSIWSMLQSQGGIASLSVLLHEIPHELGDYSILISSGFTKSEAIASQFFTAIAAFIGTFFGLFASHSLDNHDHEHDILSFTSGGFIYLAACGILPDLLNQSYCSAKLRSMQLLAFCVGIAFMYFVAILEHDHENNFGKNMNITDHLEL